MLEEVEDVPNLLPHSKVPLYNGVALFPSRPQRAALHSALLRILDLEYQKAPKDKKAERGHGEQKGSHAFLLCSDAATVLRVDTVPLAIALWRVRMWEGGGREDSADPTGGWTFKRW
ncbi:hypothetical protein A0H81_03965 [Grifola frondosa]|uniref:Uncharacterized protein n=1 Tax=Grifola frondosa TaxID=5627 RepID=A0A1C7MMI1_GRIFR|nr:hypothetical protein A0H81_03965 [Grifola frondosa]